MKFRPLPALLLSVIAAAGAPGRAETPPAAAPGNPHELTIVVVESIGHDPSRTNFDRIDSAFTKVFNKRKWPLTIKVERFAANAPAYENELRVFYKGTYSEMPGDLTFHAWVTFEGRGEKRDFGMIKYRYYPRPGQSTEDVLDAIFRGGAALAADKLEAVLFPKDGAKP
jgi:hypothetical protein